MQFTLQVSSSVNVDKLTTQTHHHNQDTDQFCHLLPRSHLFPFNVNHSPPLFPVSIQWLLQECHINGIQQYVAFESDFFHLV